MCRPRGPLLRLALFLGAALVMFAAGQVRADDLTDRVRGYRLEARACTPTGCRALPTRGAILDRVTCRGLRERFTAGLPALTPRVLHLPARASIWFACAPVPGLPCA